MTFWDTDAWHAYEVACGDAPGTRSALLASSDWMTRVVDLALSEAELWRGVRKSYKSLIRRAERTHDLTPTRVLGLCLVIDVCAVLHETAAGRITRPSDTWRMMCEWVTAGHGEAWLATTRGDQPDPVGFVYVVIFGAWAYYFSAASRVDNVSHALLWHAMKALKARGVRWFELGWMDRPCDTDKDRGIAQFKRGFGGYDVPAKEAPCLASTV